MTERKVRRVSLIVLDSVGIGELPDAADYGDKGSNTLANVAKAVQGLNLPKLAKLGLVHIHPLRGAEPMTHPFCLIRQSVQKIHWARIESPVNW